MLKLVLEDPVYYYPEVFDQFTTICRVKSTLVDSETGCVLAVFNKSAKVTKSDFDEQDTKLANNLSYSYVKIKSYKAAQYYIKHYLNIYDSIVVASLTRLKRAELKEQSHADYLLNNEYNPVHYDLLINTVRELLNSLPVIRGEKEDTRIQIENCLTEIENSLN